MSDRFLVNAARLDWTRVWLVDQAPYLTTEINAWRRRLAAIYRVEVGEVTAAEVRSAIADLFADPGTAVNLTCLVGLCLSLAAPDDPDELMVDDLLGEAVAGLIAGREPLRTIARTNFCLIDIHTRDQVPGFDPEQVAVDDLFAGLIAGLEAILPGWR